jgi:hypothetical protein
MTVCRAVSTPSGWARPRWASAQTGRMFTHSASQSSPGTRTFCQCCGSRMFIRIPDPTYFHPGSEFFPSRIRIKEFKFLNPQKWFLSSRKYDPGCSSRIRILAFYPSRIPDPGVKKAPGPGSATLHLVPCTIRPPFYLRTHSRQSSSSTMN